MRKGVRFENGIWVDALDSISGRAPSEYVCVRYDNIPGGCSMTAAYYGILPDGTEERVDAYTSEKVEDPKFYLRAAIKNIEAEKREKRKIRDSRKR